MSRAVDSVKKSSESFEDVLGGLGPDERSCFAVFDLRRRPVLVLHCADTPVTARSLVVDGEEESIDGPIPLWWE